MNSYSGKLFLPFCRIPSNSFFRYSFSSEKKSPGNQCSVVSINKSANNVQEKLETLSSDILISSKIAHVFNAEELEWTENIEYSTTDKFILEGRIRRYTSSYEFILINGNIGTVGITEHAARELGHVVSLFGSSFYWGEIL